ncbi:hypothetical protein AV530_006561 [Patagioenas fasciata monilis]|uniref:Uncharacterized protein n=1 Tax=Patagioenas fasciata monilis TaxID=372326 RepID=A0A1V4KH06_PATFA|nr:hypothetical protein AV530_006561 [Patagioenas fasciata monilis]
MRFRLVVALLQQRIRVIAPSAVLNLTGTLRGGTASSASAQQPGVRWEVIIVERVATLPAWGRARAGGTVALSLADSQGIPVKNLLELDMYEYSA